MADRVDIGEQFDVIVVGAGLAGLSAAYELCQRRERVLVLEAEDQPGGKIITRRREGGVYELGSLFAFREDSIPFAVDAGRLLKEEHPLGVFLNGQLFSGNSVLACLRAAQQNPRQMLSLRHFLLSESPQPEAVGADAYAVLNAFFQVIHPGDLTAYVPARRLDSLARHDTAHFQRGNAALIDAFLDKADATVQTNCRVTDLWPDSDGVRVDWCAAERPETARTEWVVLATPAAEARELTAGLDSAATAFLERVRYGAGIAVVLGLCDAKLQPFAYVVSPQGSANTFIFHHETVAGVPPGLPRTVRSAPEDAPLGAEGRGLVVVTAYLVADKAMERWDANDAKLVELVRGELNALGIGAVEPGHVAFSDVCRWPAVGPIVCEETYRGFTKACLRPADRIVLAGDYTWWNRSQMPYGMQGAVASGRRAAHLVCDEAVTAMATRFQAKPLAVTTRSAPTDKGPAFSGQVEDGTVAYYGLILKAEPDAELERYLVGEAEGGLWTYQQDSGVTSLDSALVMEGLLSTGRHAKLLEHSVDRLVAEFFDDEAAAFWTIPRGTDGRAAYWSGADCLATAYCAWLLQQIGAERYADTVAACADYLKRKQLITGRWPGKWFPSETVPVFYATRLLAGRGGDHDDACQRAGRWLLSQQTSDGSWQGSVIESAAAVLALCALGGHDAAVRRACEWIMSRGSGHGWVGEPILHYWIEERGKRTGFYTTDKGRITTAWATLALREVNCLDVP